MNLAQKKTYKFDNVGTLFMVYYRQIDSSFILEVSEDA